MPEDLLASKLNIPPLRPSLVPRPRLIDRLDEGLRANRGLTLVSAPAGFGKTTLVVDWLQRAGLPAAWLSLDEADNDLPRFLAYLAAALQQVDEEIGAPLQSAVQSPQLPPIEKALAGLLNQFAGRADPFMMVLDDFHLLTEASVIAVVKFLLDHQPPQLHLLITTREDPDLPLARLRARGQLTEIRAGDLRFTPGEAGQFLRGPMGLAITEQDLAALAARTEGWAAGLQLAGLSMQKHGDPKSFIDHFSGSHRHILDYLSEEVLRQQPEDIRAFLLRTSILDSLCGSLCDAVAGRDDSDRVLARLEAANLFIVPLDEERRWYRYHHLFSELLRGQLARSQPEEIPLLHRRASRWYEEHGEIRAAVEHALQDAGPGRAAQLIEQYAFPMLYQGHVAVVLGWFDRLPEGALHAAPMACIAKAWALALMQRSPRAGAVDLALADAGRALEQAGAGQALRDLVAGHAASIRAYLLQTPARMGEKPETLIALSQEANRRLPPDEKAIRSVNSLNIGYANLVLVDLPAAETAFRATLEDGLAGGNRYAAIYGPTNLASVALLTGRLPEALHLCETYIEKFNKILAGQNFPPIGALEIVKGCVLLEYNRLDEAEPALLQGLDQIRWTGEYEAPIMGYPALARLHAARGDRAAMLAAVDALDETWPDGAFYTQGLRHRLLLRCCHDAPGVQENARAWLEQSGIAFETMDVIRSVAPMDALYFERCLNAAHVAARLAIHQAGAYPAGAAHDFLRRQAEFAETRGITRWAAAANIARTALYQAEGKQDRALETLAAAVHAGAPAGLFRLFLDECDPLQTLLAALKPRLAGDTAAHYADRLLAAMQCRPAQTAAGRSPARLLSERELEVLRCLAGGLTYEQIGRELFLSLNTVQFHVKNIYSKLMVNKRVQALEKAREMKLIQENPG